MKRTNSYICPNGGFRIPHNKHLGNKHNEWLIIKRSSNCYETRR